MGLEQGERYGVGDTVVKGGRVLQEPEMRMAP